LLEYDEVMDEQRKRVYSFRQRLLDGEPAKDVILDMIDTQIKEAADRFLADDYGPASFAEWAGQRLGVELNPRSFKGLSYEDAAEEARREAESQAGSQIREAVEENLPDEAEASEYNWLALATWFNGRYGTSLKDKDLRKFATFQGNEVELDRREIEDFLHEKASAAIQAVDLEPAKELLLEDWGRRTLGGWAYQKFGVAIDPATWSGTAKTEVVKQLQSQSRELYARKEAEFPVRVGLTKFLAERSQGQQSPRYDRDGLASWASERFGVYIDPEEIRSKLRPEIEAMLLEIAHREYPGVKLAEELTRRLDLAFPEGPFPRRASPTGVDDLTSWANEEFDAKVTAEELTELGFDGARKKLIDALDAEHRPEMREMEKVLVLQILDQSWMEHLRTMDHLRSSVGLRGYAQVDPKVEYKREGMKIFEEMWSGVSDKVTDLVFKMEQLDPDFLSYLGSRWQLDRAQAIHRAPEPEVAAVAGGVRAAQDAAISTNQAPTEVKREPVRNLGKKVGRNDPCPCGSGKKFKACHMKKDGQVDVF
jgi:preprotein translocase subunit SecA